jgi:hypothetical protein
VHVGDSVTRFTPLLARLAAWLVCLAALAVPAAALAAPPWSPPAPLGSTPPLTGRPALTTNAQGLGLAVADAGGANAPGPRSRASVFTGGAFGDAVDLTPPAVSMGPGSGAVAAYGETRLIGAGVSVATSSQRAVVAFGRLTPGQATMDTPRPLGPSGMHAHRASLAVNAGGDAAIVYPVCRDAGCTKVLVYLAVRRAGSSTFSSTRLADGSGPLPQVTVAINSRGDALAVWSQASTLYGRIRTAGGTLRARQTLGPAVRGMHLAPSAALSLHRSELVGWLAQAVSEGDGGPGQAWVARSRDGTGVTRTSLGAIPAAGAGHYVSEAGLRVAFDPAGRSLVAFTAFDGAPDTGRFSVRTAQVTGAANNPTQTLADVQTISNPALDTVLSGMLVGPAGNQLVTMLAGVRGNDPMPGGPGPSVQAATRAAGTTGAFAREEVTAPGPSVQEPFGVDAARLSDGRVVAAWTTPGAGTLFSERSTPLG